MNRSSSVRWPVRWLKRAERLGRHLENAVLVALLGGLVVIAAGQIVLRDGFSLALPWADGVVRVAVLWIAMVGAVAASRDRKHIAIEVAGRLLPPAWRRPLEVLRYLVTAAVCALLARFAWSFVADSRNYGDLFSNLWPAWWFQLVLPVGFGLIAYRFAVRAVETWLGLPIAAADAAVEAAPGSAPTPGLRPAADPESSAKRR